MLFKKIQSEISVIVVHAGVVHKQEGKTATTNPKKNVRHDNEKKRKSSKENAKKVEEDTVGTTTTRPSKDRTKMNKVL